MGRRETSGTAASSRRKSVAVLIVLAAVVGGAAAVRWYWRRETLARVVDRGLQMLTVADTPAGVAAVLDEWERQTSQRWRSRRDDLIRHLLSNRSVEDQRVRLLLTRVAGVDYGGRREEWQQWFEARQCLRRGEQPRVSPGQRVRLKPLWRTSVGLTAWFSTIIPLDGQIYVASLGASFDDTDDTADGVVCVDGASGEAELIFEPPDGRMRDVLGIAAGDGCLFATCRNGFIYCVEADGALRWSAGAGGPLSGPPLSIDINRDGVSDVVAVTRAGQVVAISGRTGNTAWVTSAPRQPAANRAATGPALGATLATGALSDGAGRELVVTTADGRVRVLAARNGRLRWEGVLRAGSLAGAVVCVEQADGGSPAFVADRDARVWSLLPSGGDLEMVPAWDLLIRPDESVVAGLRALASEGAAPAVVCPTGSYWGPGASVCVLDPGLVRWRYATQGAIWATPALADVNGDGETELIVASIDAGAGDQAIGVLTILSARGQCLRQRRLSAPLECSPVVADVDGDGRLEVLVADQAGWLYCFATERIGPVEWGLFGGDSHNTRNRQHAYSFGQVPDGAQWNWKPD